MLSYSENILNRALTSDLTFYIKSQTLIPGVYAGFDPAEINDASALVVLGKDIPTKDIPNPKLKCRMMRDLSLDDEGVKNVTYLQQAREIIRLDSRYRFTKLFVDITSHRAVFEFLQEHFGPRAEGVVFTKPLKGEMINVTRVAFQEMLLEFNPNHTFFPLLRKELHELDSTKLKHPDGGTDDFVWALSLAIKATDVISYKEVVDSGECDEELIF